MGSDKPDKNKDIFLEAAKLAANSVLIKPTPVQIEEAVELIDEGDNNWDKIREAIDGKYSKRFMEVLDTLPDREFARNYLKLLEYVKPKVTRKDETPIGEQDNRIVIQVFQLQKDGTRRIIDITEDATLLQDGE